MSPAEQEQEQQASIPFQVHHKDLNLCETLLGNCETYADNTQLFLHFRSLGRRHPLIGLLLF